MIPAHVEEAMARSYVGRDRLAYVGRAVCKVTYGKIAPPQVLHVVKDPDPSDGAQLALVLYIFGASALCWISDREFNKHFEMLP